MRILTADQMREADRRTIEEIGIPSLVLMENAGRQVVAAMESIFQDLSERRVAVLSGKGNNGGDGFVVARTLHQRGVDVSVFVVGQVAEIKGDARINLEILGRLGDHRGRDRRRRAWELHFSEISGHNLIVDALFGTGLKSALSGIYETIIADINSSGIPVVSIDLPSGMSADTPDLHRRLHRGDDDGDARRAEAAAGAAAGGAEGGRGGDRRHRHSRRRLRRRSRAARRAADARSDAAADHAARRRMRTRAISAAC